MCSGGLRAVKIKVLRTALRPMVLCQACFWSSQYPWKRYGLLHFSRTCPGGRHLPLVLHCPCPSPTCLPETGLRHVPAPLLHVSSNCHCELRPVTPWAPNPSPPCPLGLQGPSPVLGPLGTPTPHPASAGQPSCSRKIASRVFLRHPIPAQAAYFVCPKGFKAWCLLARFS